MSRFTKDSKFRLRDFSKRVNYSPESVYKSSAGFEYIPVHPFSDEDTVLKELYMRPEECRAVDAYWHMGTDIGFLQMQVICLRHNPLGTLS